MIRLFIFVVAFILPLNASAVSSNFNVKTLVGDDTTSPSTPNLISVLPVSYSQIDINWSVSIDNFSSVNYVLYRNGASLATTSLTNFSDTGLLSDTLYTYEVKAFDSSYNFSTTSNSLSTTTLSLPPTPPPSVPDDEDVESTRIFMLKDFQVETSNNSAYFSWETSLPSSYSLRWGKNTEYDAGYISSELFSKKQKTQITELEPNTKYYYELTGHFPSGVKKNLKADYFKTDEVLQKFTPPNVSRLTGVFDGENGALLSWQLPAITNIKAVRVVSNYYNFPNDKNDGKIIYEGLASEARDIEAFANFTHSYYSVFVIDLEGNVSSGAIVKINKDDHLNSNENKDSISSTTNNEEVEKNIFTEENIRLKNFDLNNIYIYQEDMFYDFNTSEIKLSYIKPFTISIPKETLPEHLKSIIVTLLDPTNHHRSYSFLLKINPEETAYEATIASLKVVGVSKLQIEIYDFTSGLKGLYSKQINFVIEDDVSEIEQTFTEKMFKGIEDNFTFVLSIFVFILMLVFYYKYRLRIISND